MPTHTRHTHPATTTSTCKLPRCPDCGGLECLCRPNFFAGQLLTERELNGSQRYVIEKNKLHNRYLHGWGVVCGLVVHCDFCDPCEREGVQSVSVTEGYALSPCGEDVVLCRDERVPVCELIDKCRPAEPDCDDDRGRDPCTERPEHWVLAVAYDERGTRGITPLRSPDCCPTCGCSGGTSGCGCGGDCGCGNGNGNGDGHGHGHKTASSYGGRADTRMDRCSAPLGCEPTIVCEGHRFVVWPLEAERDDRRGAMEERFRACVDELERYLPARPNENEDDAERWFDWFCRWKQGIREYAVRHPLYRCDLLLVIDSLRPADPGDAEFRRSFPDLRRRADVVEALIKLACLCTALHPPCPPEIHKNSIPLAVLTIDRNREDCRVTSICNWTSQRKHVITFPNLAYWLSPLPFGRLLRAMIEALCCDLGKRGFGSLSGIREARAEEPLTEAGGEESFERPAYEWGAAATGGDERDEVLRLRVPAVAGEDVRATTRLAFGVLSESQRPQALVDAMEAALGGAPDERPAGHEALFLLLDQLGKPLLEATAGGVREQFAETTPPDWPPEERDPADELRELRETVASQSERIEALLRRLEEHE
jgi:hypothetical protein